MSPPSITYSPEGIIREWTPWHGDDMLLLSDGEQLVFIMGETAYVFESIYVRNFTISSTPHIIDITTADLPYKQSRIVGPPQIDGNLFFVSNGKVEMRDGDTKDLIKEFTPISKHTILQLIKVVGERLRLRDSGHQSPKGTRRTKP